MASEFVSLNVRVVCKNERAVKALGVAARTLLELAEEMPYRAEVQKAARAMRYAVKNLDADIKGTK